MSWLKNRISEHANAVEANRTNALEWFVKEIERQSFDDWLMDAPKAAFGLLDAIIERFDKIFIPESIELSAKFYGNITKDKAPETPYPQWRVDLIERSFDREVGYWLSGYAIQIEKFENMGAGTLAVNELLKVDWAASLPELKESKDKRTVKFSVGAGKYYASFWTALAQMLNKEYNLVNTVFTNLLLENG